MTIDEALKINKEVWFCMHLDHRNDEEDAIKLGIEALKLVTSLREQHTGWVFGPLPGETKD